MDPDVPEQLAAARRDLGTWDLTEQDAPRRWRERWTAALDDALRTLHTDADRPRAAVVATGGYGRSETCPGSDVDLLLLVDPGDDGPLDALVKAVVYPLWDAGLTVGHAVRTVDEAARTAADDIDIATATLAARTVAGPADLAAGVRRDLVARLRRHPGRFLDRLAQRDGERRVRYGDVAEILEPDLKEGAGGLRDVQSLMWAAAALFGEVALDPLVAGGYLSAPDRARLARAYRLLLDVRVALHLEAQRGTDVLTFERQDPVARRLGLGDGQALLHRLYLAARSVDHVHRAAWATIQADLGRRGRGGGLLRRRQRPVERELAPGFGIAAGVVRIAPEVDVRAQAFPADLLEVLADSGAALDRHSAGTVARAIGTGQVAWSWDGRTRRRFLGVLWRGAPAVDALAELDDLGVLVTLLPEWAAIRGRPQRNPYHRYSLDRHAIHTAAALGDLVRDEAWAAATLEEVADTDALMLATLLHDVGKAHGEPHSETGAPVASGIARRVGASSETCALVGRLVRSHLLLPETATRRDLTDPRTAAEVATTVADVSTLGALHLLSVADGRATGPAAWTPWKAELVAELVRKVRDVLDEATPDAEAQGARTVDEAIALAVELGVDPVDVRTHLDRLPDRYAWAVSPRAIVRHAGAAATSLTPGEVRPRVTPAEDGLGLDDLDIVALDRPGLFAKVAGVLALHGGSIVSARAFTRSDGIAVDTFRVARPPDVPGGTFWASVEGDLIEAVAGRLALRARVAQRAAAYRRPRTPGPQVALSVEVRTDATSGATVVEVRAQDGVGVLHRIASALAELELDVVAAKVDTVGHEVVDVFYVRDANGAALDEDHAEEVVLAVTAALE